MVMLAAIVVGVASTIWFFILFKNERLFSRCLCALAFGVAGAAFGMLWAEALPRFTAGRTETLTYTYERTLPWKFCNSNGARIREVITQRHIALCGATWDIPAFFQRGQIQVTERVGPFGVRIVRVGLPPP